VLTVTEPSTAGVVAEPKPDVAPIVPDAALLLVALIWGVNIPIMKSGLELVDVFAFNAIRLTVSALVLATLALRERRRGILPSPSLRFHEVLLYSLVISAIYNVCFLLGMAKTTPGNTALIIATVPMWTALIARIFLGEQLAWLGWGGLLTALCGTVIVALQKGDAAVGTEHLIGNMTILGAALLWAGGTVYSRKLLPRISSMQLSASAAVLALPVHLLLSIGHWEGTGPALQTPSLWLMILYSGTLSSGLALPLWNFGVRHAGAAHAAVIQNLIPLIAIVAAWASRGDPVTIPQIWGGILILGGLITMRMTRRS